MTRYWNKSANMSDLIGLTITETNLGSQYADSLDDELTLKTSCGRTFLMYHQQDCCESVSLVDVAGDFSDILGQVITDARMDFSYGDDAPKGWGSDDSTTWTYVKIVTSKGEVSLRWFGSSNGYYSETPDFYETVPIEKRLQ